MLKKDNKGTSMVTVIVSFALLLLFVTSYYRVYHLAGEMMMNAKDILHNNSSLIKAYYLGETQEQVMADRMPLTFSGEEGSFYVEGTLRRAQTPEYNGSIYYYLTDGEEPGEVWQE